MMQFSRPPQPREFTARGDGKINTERKAVAQAVRAKRKPVFPEHWKDFKSAFSRAQSGKCGYCELPIAAGQPGDVEHFAPKREVWALGDDPATWGKETTDGLSNITGREKTVLFNSGYWFRAYDWSNYLFACTVCNSRWKLSYFPVKPAGKRRTRPSLRNREQPLLLNCFDDEAPWEHFRFTPLGQIEKITERGFETIRTCGLDRETLRVARQAAVQDAHDECKLLLKNQHDLDALKRLVKFGAPHRAFAGVVRAVARELLGVPWHKLEARAYA